MIEWANENIEEYIAIHCLPPDLFAELLEMVTPYIAKQNTVMWEAISPGARLAISLHYLAIGKYKNFLYIYFLTPDQLGQYCTLIVLDHLHVL